MISSLRAVFVPACSSSRSLYASRKSLLCMQWGSRMWRRSYSLEKHVSTNITDNDHGVTHLGVVGAGQMGGGIALVAAQVAKIPRVTMVDKNQDRLNSQVAFLESLLSRSIKKKRITQEEKEEVMSRLHTSTEMSALRECEFVIEAVSEDLDLKKSIFQSLEKICPTDAILATNTSSISITKIASCLQRPERVIGEHFMNPVPQMRLVEVIRGLQTNDETLQTTVKLAHAMRKQTTFSKDSPGFIANRLLMPYINEAVTALDEGIGTAQDIDATLKLGCNMPMGPLELADFIGLDTCLAIMKVLHTELGDSKYRPALGLIQYVDAGWLGKKTGRGFYIY
eukprot:Nk52_evm1s2297 gene=Nk52_evmTU1s2297